MPQYFVLPEDSDGALCRVRGEDFHHLARVRRAAPGDEVELRLPDGSAVAARVLSIGAEALTAEIIDKKSPSVVPLNLTLYASLLKGKLFDLVVRKAVELGVMRVVPMITERTVVDVDGKEDRRRERWSRIAAEAAKQCMRPDVPGVHGVLGFGEALDEGAGVRIIAHPDCGDSAREIRASEAGCEAALMVGPEGGFSGRELSAAKEKGWRVMSFGSTQLRAETAALVLPAILIYEWSLTE